MCYHTLGVLCLLPLMAAGANGQDIGTIIEKVYLAVEQQEQTHRNLYPYSYSQEIRFQKRDDDGGIDEQSHRAYRVTAESEDSRERVLLKAMNYEDGAWVDVTAEEQENPGEGEHKKFSLSELVGPENRGEYIFTLAGQETFADHPVYHVTVAVKVPDEDRFKGDLWIHAQEYVVLKAILSPSDLPAAVDAMTMVFEMSKESGYWMPARVGLNAEISFLFFFSGRISSDITFSDYRFPAR